MIPWQYIGLETANPLTPTVAICVQLHIEHPVPDRVKPSFVIFDIRTLWRSAPSVKVPDVKNYKWRFNPVWHGILYSCTHGNSGRQRVNTNRSPPHLVLRNRPLTVFARLNEGLWNVVRWIRCVICGDKSAKLDSLTALEMKPILFVCYCFRIRHAHAPWRFLQFKFNISHIDAEFYTVIRRA